MKKQLFYLLYEDENDRNYKLVMNYVNRFIVEEDAECEVIKTFQLTNRNEFKISEYKLIQKLRNLYSYIFQSAFEELFTLFETLQIIEGSRSIIDEDFKKHVIIGTSKFESPLHAPYFLSFYISIKYSTQCSVLWSSPGEQVSKNNLRNLNNTIGNDIDAWIESDDNFKPSLGLWIPKILNAPVEARMISFKLLTQSQLNEISEQNLEDFDAYRKRFAEFKESEDFFMKTKIRRLFFPYQVHPGRSALFLIAIIMTIMIIFILFPPFIINVLKKLSILNWSLRIKSVLPISASLARQFHLIKFLRFGNSFLEVGLRIQLTKWDMPITHPNIASCILLLVSLLWIPFYLFLINAEIFFKENSFEKN